VAAQSEDKLWNPENYEIPSGVLLPGMSFPPKIVERLGGGGAVHMEPGLRIFPGIFFRFPGDFFSEIYSQATQ
jgi:hypothetical protein